MIDEDWHYWLETLENDLIGIRSRVIRLEDTATTFQQNIFEYLEKKPHEQETEP